MVIHNRRDINRLECRDKDYLVAVAGVPELSVRIYPNGKKNFICVTPIHISPINVRV
nr:hypothetical protein [Psychrobacter sp. PraFG1]UNK06409.1 hypothetical protein MN210_07825 [Psychrobacter sp. PraFG1]